jgi:hypothetical protein
MSKRRAHCAIGVPQQASMHGGRVGAPPEVDLLASAPRVSRQSRPDDPKTARMSRNAGIAWLLLIACALGTNHVAARLAFDHGVSVPTAVVVRSLVAAAFVLAH